MRTLLYLFAALAVMGLGFWAYSENYQTQTALKEVRSLRNQVAQAHARLGVLSAEWAYLNRPARLKDLAELNFDRLGLLPMSPDSFGHFEEIDYPHVIPSDLIGPDGAVDVTSPLIDQGEPL